MDLTTRCPQCGVEFPVSLQQLQLRKGYIRCANCAHIFDGYEAVVPASGREPTASPAAFDATPQEPEFSTPETRGTPMTVEPHFVVSAPEHPADIPIRKREASESAAFVVRDIEPLSESGRSHTIGGGGRSDGPPPDTLYVEPRQERHTSADFDHRDDRAGLGVGGVFWSLLVLLGVAGALLQAAYIYRVQIASEVPALRPALERYCETLNCTVEYPRRLAQIAIMDSSLQAVRDDDGIASAEDEDSRQMVLDVVLRNNFDRPQQWPSMSIELIDFSGVVAARRTLAPADYLPELSLQRPFPAKSEVRVSVPIMIDGLRINGYQLNTFFP